MSESSIRPAFTDVDRSSDPHQAVKLLDAQHGSDFIFDMEQRALQWLDVQPGQHILDAGCGTGKQTQVFANLAGVEGSTMGLDFSATMVTEAVKRNSSVTSASYIQGDIHQLPFAGAQFDRCYAERVFQHLPDPQQALRSLMRVTKPGGKIVILEPDHEMVTIDTPYHEVNRRFIEWRCNTFRAGWVAHQLYGWFKMLGVSDVAVELVPVVFTDYAIRSRVAPYLEEIRIAAQQGVVTEAEANAWCDFLEAAIRACRFLSTQLHVITVARL